MAISGLNLGPANTKSTLNTSIAQIDINKISTMNTIDQTERTLSIINNRIIEQPPNP